MVKSNFFSKYYYQGGFVALLLLAIAGNYLSIPLYPGVDFIFGSIFLILILNYYSLPLALTSAVLSFLYTAILWGHEFGIILYTLELVFIAIIKTRYIKNTSYFILDTLFWLTLGPILMFINIVMLLDLPLIQGITLWLKGFLNGVFNLLVADIIIYIYNRYRYNIQIYFRNILAIFFTSTLFTIMLISTVIEIKSTIDNDIKTIQNDIEEIARQIQEIYTIHHIDKNFITLLKHYKLEHPYQISVYNNNTQKYLYGKSQVFKNPNGTLKKYKKDISIWEPQNSKSNIEKFKNSFFMQTLTLDNYTIIIENSFKNRLDNINNLFLNKSILMIVLLISILIAIYLFNKYILQTIESYVTQIKKLKFDKDALPTGSFVYEIDYILKNTTAMNRELKNTILQLYKKEESLLFFKTVLDHSIDGILILSKSNGSIIEANETIAKLLNYSKTELKYLTIFDITSNKDEWKLFISNFNDSKRKIFEDKLISKYGKSIDMDMSISLYEDMLNSYLIIITRDLTERNENIKEMKRKDEILITQSRSAALGEMIGNIAHQWRQPLAIIAQNIQNFELAQRVGKLTPEYLKEKINKVTHQVEHMSKTIDDFTNFFKPNKNRVKFCINKQIESTLKLLEDSFEYAGISIIQDLESNPTNLKGYPNEFSQVILNILQNAKDVLIEKKIHNPKISISTEFSGEKATIVIDDNGEGIGEEHIHKIFDPYFTTKGPNKGTGIGLYMSKTIIEKHLDGTIKVENSEEGAKFTIIIPLK